MDKRRAADSFLGYFPNWKMFSHDIVTHRDTKTLKGKTEEDHVVHAISLLAYLTDQSAQLLRGSYESVQANGRAAIGDRDLLLNCYIQVAQAYSANPKKALEGIEGIDSPGIGSRR